MGHSPIPFVLFCIEYGVKQIIKEWLIWVVIMIFFVVIDVIAGIMTGTGTEGQRQRQRQRQR